MSGEQLRVLAQEQAALRRVATLVARGVAPEEVFAAVTEEVGRLVPVEYAHLGRYESDGTTMTGVPTPESTPSSRAATPSGPEASAKPSIRAARPVSKTSVLTFFPPRLHRRPPRGAMGSPVLPQPATMVIVVPSDS